MAWSNPYKNHQTYKQIQDVSKHPHHGGRSLSSKSCSWEKELWSDENILTAPFFAQRIWPSPTVEEDENAETSRKRTTMINVDES